MTDTVTQQTTGNGTLPETWEWTTLSDIGTVASGGTPKTKEPSNFDGDIPWITPADLSGYTDKTIAHGKRNISQKGLDSSSARLLPEGTVIFSSRAPVGYVVIAEDPVSTNQGCKNLITSDGVFNEYVFYYLKGSKSLAESYASGTTFLELSAKAFGRLPIPLPPLNEQRRIVEKMEELLTKLDAGVQYLKQTQILLKSYRRSVLKAAVEGELSREWREAHRDELEPASELLERIFKERREKLAGKKYKEPASPDTSELSSLPEGWACLSLDQASERIVDCLHSTPKFTEEGKYCIDTNCIAPGKILFDRARKVTESTYKERIRRLPPEENDILFAREGTIGTAVLVPNNVNLCLGQRMMMFRSSMGVLPRFFMWALLSPMFERQWKPRVVGTTAPHVNIRDLRIMAIPLPSLDEQRYIVEEVEQRLSVVDKLEATIEANLKQVDALRQSILKRAFSGDLVPQHPDDEPASVLLERIRAERDGAKPKSRKGRQSTIGPTKSNPAEQGGLF